MVTRGAYAGDDTLGASVAGQALHTMSILSGDSLSYQDPGDMGIETYTLTGGPVQIEITDNDYELSADSVIVGATITSSLPTEYNDTYRLRVDTPTWNASTDNEFTPMVVGGGNLSTGETIVAGAYVAQVTGKVLHGTLEHDVQLIVLENKRITGSTSDSITVQYTFYDF